MGLVRRWLIRVAVLTSLLTAAIHVLRIDGSFHHDDSPTLRAKLGAHPIDRLVGDARSAQQMHSASTDAQRPTLEEAARLYRARRGRHPPPGFEAWHTLAVRMKAAIPELFFDQIYEDLEPFWGEDPQKLRSFAVRWPNVISVRNQTAQLRTKERISIWLNAWRTAIDTLPVLPDVDLALSPNDEPHVLVPFHNLNRHMEEAARQRRLHNQLSVADIQNEMVKYPEIATEIPDGVAAAEEGLQYISPATHWEHIVQTCRPGDPIGPDHAQHFNPSNLPIFSKTYTAGTDDGFVSNFTTAKSVCQLPNIHTLHGQLIAPSQPYVFTELQPVIGVAKMQGVNNDIIFPNPSQMLGWGDYQLESSYKPWGQKRNMAVWRGTAFGGLHDESTWRGMQRLRFVSFTNSTVISYLENRVNRLKSSKDPSSEGSQSDTDLGNNIPFPSPSLFHLAAQRYAKLGQWTSQLVDTALTNYFCAPFRFFGGTKECAYLDPYYSIGNKMTPGKIDGYKYLPDIDGQSSSGRYRSFLHSFSVPIKASIFTEWADARLRPWLHFVPMSNEFQEWFAILEYFLGYQSTAGTDELSVPDHDVVGQWIGQQGADWSRKVLRVEDMQLYMYRVILEYARICADDRVRLGWVGDLV